MTAAGQTFTDGLYYCLWSTSSSENIDSLINILVQQEYDTDSLIIDIALGQKNGQCNPMQLIDNEETFKVICDHIYDQKCM